MIHIPRGTQDILPEETTKWRYIENQLHKLMEVYNYQEIRTPILKVPIYLRAVWGLYRCCTKGNVHVQR